MTTILNPIDSLLQQPSIPFQFPRVEQFGLTRGTAQVVPASVASHHMLMQTALAAQICDYRYYDLVHRTLGHDFPIAYFVIRGHDGELLGAQPFFIVEQNILAGMQGRIASLAEKVRARFPSFCMLKTMMLGNPAGPGALGVRRNATAEERAAFVAALGEAVAAYGAQHHVRIAVFKDLPASNRADLAALTDAADVDNGLPAGAGYLRVPSMPMTQLDLTPYDSFDDYMNKALSKVTRKGLRRKFKRTTDEKITFSVTSDISDCAHEIHRLYLQVYERATLKFEKITPAYLRELSRQMPERARFFLWRKDGDLVAASVTLVRFPDRHGTQAAGSALYDLYLGMDYPLALDLSLYFLTMRDVIQWCIENRIATYYSTPLNYDAKLHFRHRLVPQDLYVRHLSAVINPGFKVAMRFAAPTRHDAILPQFENFAELA